MKKLIIIIYSMVLALTAFSQNTPTKVPKEIALGWDTIVKYLGTYEFSPQFKAKIKVINNKVYAQRVGDSQKHLLIPIASNRFFMQDIEQELEFVANEKGEYDKAILHAGDKPMTAQRIEKRQVELEDVIAQLDKDMFDAYNNRDLDKFLSFLSPDIEFYHDLGGLSHFEDNKKVFEANFKKEKKMRRELVSESLEVYPIKDYGAIQIGVHKFFVTQNGEEQFDSSPKFVQVWQNKNGQWKIVRIVSYAH